MEDKQFGHYTVSYIPFIENFVKKLYHRFGRRYDYEELLSVAMEASLKAEKKYDPQRARFSTYARRYIEGAILKSITQMSPKQQQLLNRIYKYVDKYVELHNAIPNIEVVLKALEITEAQYEALPANQLVFTQFTEVDSLTEEDELLYELDDAVERLPDNLRLAVTAYREDKPHSKHVLKKAITELKRMLND